ncbi:cilia- and flagella-associated protein 47 [Talpa occidentalis]|uniref:cilia- and flagella-associated protein 47 n=1 Tax=Talpa occidentalis TaxID=50954 RepID=UPI0023F8DBEF|nr:cilia- and flagella-associated protein 47 [Talpa occidentalis]
MGTERVSLVPRDMEIPRKDLQLRVTPTELKFMDTLVGRVYRLPITVHNLGRSNQKIRFQEPIKPQFRLILTNLDKALASGLQMTAMVEYHPDKNEDTFDQLIISIGNKTIEIPLMGLIPSCQLHIEPEVDFGTLVANSKVYSKEVHVINYGKAPGWFKIEYQGRLPIIIFPTDGIVEAKSSVVIKMDFCADQPRTVHEVARVSLQGRPDILLSVKALLVEPIIELLSLTNERRLDCVRFGSVFFGTSKIEQILLYNNSPEPINWVAILQDDSVGEELGTNIPQRTDVVLNNLTCLRKVKDIDVTTFISCIPNDGQLLPYEKIVITFCFSPKLVLDSKKNFDPSHRQDYVVFLRFESVGSKEGFLRDDNESIKGDRYRKVELALTGTGLPVLLHFDPGQVLDFAPCFMGECSEITCIMHNHSKSLPVVYDFRKTAHFKIDPQRGKLDEGCIQNVTCSFIPHQVGIFSVKQCIQIIGAVANEDLLSTSLKPFHHVYLEFNSVCKPSSKEVVMDINPGISPLVSNPTGQFVIKDLVKYKDSTHVAMLQSKFTNIHNHRQGKQSVKDALIAYPNDRTASIRSGDQHKRFRTIFTKTPRYNYVDPDYAYTESEKMKKKEHENYYMSYIKHLREVRLQKETDRLYRSSYTDSEIGLQQASGIKSPVLSLSEVEEEVFSECRIKPHQLLSIRNISSKETKCLKRKVLKGLKSYPSTPHEKHDCSLLLTPKQIHQVVVGPTVLNYGDICANSTNTRLLHVINMLSMHIIIQLDVNLDELRKTNQFSYVIPPTSSTHISVLFESPTVGKFWKSFTFTVNNIPGGHILVMAVIHPVRLELSSSELVLRPHGFLVKKCFRATVRLYNRQNYFVQFEWQPVHTAKGMAFSITPVKAMKHLIALRDKRFIHFNASQWQSVISQLGHTKVTFLEPRILFNNIPQGLTSWRKAILHNVGQNHAYFKVCDQSLMPTINIVPSEGIIPWGGLTVLNISCTPTVAEKFDTRAKVSIHRANIIDLRIGGSVEIADVVIKPDVFNFTGTYVGTTEIIPFLVKNKGLTRARVEFNLEEFPCFSMEFKDKSVQYSDPEFPKIYFFELEENASVECGIAFSPEEVATYQFTFQVEINFYKASELYTERCLSKRTLTPKTTPLIRPCDVQATVLQSPLKLSCIEFIFEIPLHCMDPENKVPNTQNLVIHNTSKKNVKWVLDINNYDKVFKDGTFKFSLVNGILGPYEECNVSINFCPNHPKKYTVDIPMYLNDNPHCYRTLHLIGEVKSPNLSFDPPFILFTPVPLGVATVMDINILPQNYFSDSTLHVRIPTARLFDGEETHPLAVTFPNGMKITGSPNGANVAVTCHLVFKSCKPVSFFTNILFCDDKNNWFSLPVTATSENCILTIYPYMAIYIDKQKVVLKNGMEILYERLKSGRSGKSKREGKTMKKEEKNKQFISLEEGSKTYNFFEKVISAVQVWFSLFGWPDGPHSLIIPETIRRDVYKIQFCSTSSPKKCYRENDFTKYNKTIYDVILHLSGKMLPGVNSSQSLPLDCTERVIQLHFQHSSLLEFLTAQGACISHVLPEFLLEPEDYKKWIEITSSSNTSPGSSNIPLKKHSLVLDMTKFEDWSKRAWTDVFLQIYKVLVLSRVTPHPSSNLPHTHVQKSPKVNPSFLSSNIYSASERIILSWMNTNYENARHVIWKNYKGAIPSERWIVNFDNDLSDGLVFAAQMGAYCPFLIESYFLNMYTEPKRPEHYLHNCLIIVNVLREIGFDMDIQATDICDPNPILMLMLCVYMYERLPTYLPKKVVPFHCTLHDTVLRQILLKNSSTKNLVYSATIVGKDAADFSLAQAGNTVTISPKNEITITLKFRSRFLRPAAASLILISKSKHAVGGATMTFALKGEVLNFKTFEVIKCNSPCYTWKEISLNVKNPFHVAGDFSVILVESSTFISLPSQLSGPDQVIDHMTHSDYVRSSKRDIGEGCSQTPTTLKTSIKSDFIREFFCSRSLLNLGLKGSTLELYYLPFGIHIRYCVIILSNKKIGELIYILEGSGTMPLPSSFLPMDSLTPIDYHRSPEEGLNKTDPVLYLQCELGQVLDVKLNLPLTNEAKEKALAFAAQQQMSRVEYERRSITGTLDSSSVRVAIALLGLTKIESCLLFNISKLKKPKSVVYTTELSLPEHFDIPKKIYVPGIPQMKTKLNHSRGVIPINKTVPDESVPVPLRFVPLSPGRYPCKILLTSRYDVRVYHIEGVVNQEYPEARFVFETPAFEPLTQNIPIKNHTKNEWKCQADIEGECFYGPPILYVKPGETVTYPLTFKPILECEIMGKLSLQNEVDGLKHTFEVKGIGRKPVALEHITVRCEVGIITNKPIMVPNYTNTMITYKVSSDLPIVWGNTHITVDAKNVLPYVLHICPWKRGVITETIMVPNYTNTMITYKVSSDLPIVWGNTHITVDAKNVLPYVLHICPWKRGVITGTISFSVETRRIDQSEEDLDQGLYREPSLQQSESELSHNFDEDDSDDAVSNLKVWYYLEIHTFPGSPVNIIEKTCKALESTCIKIPLSNPRDKSIHMFVQFSSVALTGLRELVLDPREHRNYEVHYAPAATGCKDESIIFQPDKCVEFWYLLRLTTELPKPTVMAEIQCDLGKSFTEMISLDNPTHETLELQGSSSNPETFVLRISTPLTVDPYSTKTVPVYFHPCVLGRTGHQACITFCCSQFKEWKFCLSGVGLYPMPLDMQKMTSYLHLHTSIVIPFQNPTKEDVLVNITLTSRENHRHLPVDHFWDSFCHETTAFKFSALSHTHGLLLPPKGNVDIPVLFVPHIMKLHKTIVIVEMVRANGRDWPIDNFDELSSQMKRIMGVNSAEIRAIYWMFPVLGLPQAPHAKTPQHTITCQAKKRIEEEVRVTLTGDFWGDCPIFNPSDFIVLPKRNSNDHYEDLIDHPQKREFEYEMIFDSEDVKSKMESCVTLYVLEKIYCIETRKITLVFNLIFSPRKPSSTHITLKIECITDGIWKYPLMLVATEPDVDDVIDIEGVGLFKESLMDFRMTSQTRESEPFTASFLHGSDPEFFVKPQAGKLLPYDTDGTLITVGFKPRMYSKKYKATLAIQTADMYWLYAINGLPQVTTPPVNVKAKVNTTNEMILNKKRVHHRNFVRENTKVIRTGVSSTIKGAPLMLKNK